MKNRKTTYNKNHKKLLAKMYKDCIFTSQHLTTYEKLMLDFHLTSSNSTIDYYDSYGKKFLNSIRDKWILYKTND